jgi:sulfate adenylyltransferase subunit 2
MSCTAAVDLHAATISEVVSEIRLSTILRGARIDDKRSEAVKKRKQQGYFRIPTPVRPIGEIAITEYRNVC